MTACLFREEAGVERGRGEGGGGKRDLPLRFGRSVGLSVLGPLSSSSVYVFASPLSSFFPGTNRRSLPSSSSTPRRRRVPDKEEGWPCSVGFPLFSVSYSMQTLSARQPREARRRIPPLLGQRGTCCTRGRGGPSSIPYPRLFLWMMIRDGSEGGEGMDGWSFGRSVVGI